jgi:MtN3 and saliva related transmembrane protein
MNAFEIIGYLAGICTAVCFLPQSIKTIKTRKTEDISALSYSVYTVGLIFWIIYGAYLNSVPMVVFNIISLLFSVAILSVTLYNLKKK